MRSAKWFLLLVVLSGACRKPLDSDSPGTGGGGGADAGVGGATIVMGGTGGITLLPPSPHAAIDGSIVINPPLVEEFDPSQLAVDISADPDAGGEPSTGIVIFDRSGSMSGGWSMADDSVDGGIVVSKWVAASRALLSALAPVQYRVTIGAILFPTNGCEVAPITDPPQFAFMPAGEFISEYIARSPLNQPTGSTPLTLAFEHADQAIQAARAEGRMASRFFVMVLTDGMPNCSWDEERVQTLTAGWLAQGIETYVFGLPGSEGAKKVLDAIALAGGTQTMLIPGSPQQLEAGMAAAF